MDRVTYQELVARFGTTQAFDLLMTIEKMAKIKEPYIRLDEEERLERALDALSTQELRQSAKQQGVG